LGAGYAKAKEGAVGAFRAQAGALWLGGHELKRYALLETVYRPAQAIDAVRQLRGADTVTTDPRAINNKTRVRLP
jgi:hypothetical protein